MAFELKQHAIVYFWQKSHVGHLLEAAVDAAAKGFLRAEPSPPPMVKSRHSSLRLWHKASAREMALQAANLDLVRSHFNAGLGIRARDGDIDVTRKLKLSERDAHLLMQMRSDHAPLQASRAYPDAGPCSLGAYLRAEGCPCRQGPQTRAHVLWECDLPGVLAARAKAATEASTSTRTASCRASGATSAGASAQGAPARSRGQWELHMSMTAATTGTTI